MASEPCRTTRDAIIGIDVSRDWLDFQCLPSNQRLQLPNSEDGHARVGDLAKSACALVRFEATGGQEWRLWSALDVAGDATKGKA